MKQFVIPKYNYYLKITIIKKTYLVFNIITLNSNKSLKAKNKNDKK